MIIRSMREYLKEWVRHPLLVLFRRYNNDRRNCRAIDIVKEERDKLVKAMSEIDKDKLSLYELKTYAEILGTVSKIQVDNYFDKLTQMFNNNSAGFGGFNKPVTIGDMKGVK